MTQVVGGPIFYSDAHAKYLMTNGSPRYTNVYQNIWGEYFYGSSHRLKIEADRHLHNTYKKGHKPLYRIVVRRKHD